MFRKESRYLLLLLLVAFLCVGGLQAAERRLDASGNTHWVTTETHISSDGTPVSEGLLYHIAQPDGDITEEWIGSTHGFLFNRNPALEIDPVLGVPLIVWVGSDGDDGADLFFTRRESAGWTPPRLLIRDVRERSMPFFEITPQFLHLHWVHAGRVLTSYDRAMFDRDTLAAVIDPESIQSDTATIIPLEGNQTDGPTYSPSTDMMFTGGFLSKVGSGESKHAVVWGIRDEPVPVGYLIRFEIERGARHPKNFNIGWMADRLVFSYSSREMLFYSIHEDDGWSETRSIPLGKGFDVSQARAELERLIRSRGERDLAK